MRDGAATRRRLLETATTEFVAHGIAGARIDRISVNARASKAQLYSYFGSKDGLFDAVFNECATMVINTVKLDGGDLPAYAVAMYDEAVRSPELTRLIMWGRLERIKVGLLVSADLFAHKLAAIADAQRTGLIDPAFDPADVLAVVNSMALTWSSISTFRVATQDDPEVEHDRRRLALRTAVRRAFARSSDAHRDGDLENARPVDPFANW